MARLSRFLAAIALLLSITPCTPARLSADEPPRQPLRRRLLDRLPPRTPARDDARPEPSTPDEEASAPNDPADEPAPEGGLLGKLGTKTLGGVQFWGDELVFHDWRIQRHALTGHCRLLDGGNRRWAFGSFEHCQEELEQIKQDRNLPPMRGRAVIVLHGLGGWRGTMKPLADHLADKGGFTVINVTYPSTRGDIATHAAALATVIKHLEDVEEINFVAHSLGNLVVRHYFADQTDEEIGRSPDPRIKRFVMLAPPNHGAARAEKLADNELFVTVLGASALQLGSGWAEIQSKLAVPTCEFGIIAGARGDGRGYNSRLEGDDDGTLSVSTTRLVGARDFTTVPVWHAFMMFNPTVQEETLRFLDEGYFVSASDRHPLLKEDEQDTGNASKKPPRKAR